MATMATMMMEEIGDNWARIIEVMVSQGRKRVALSELVCVLELAVLLRAVRMCHGTLELGRASSDSTVRAVSGESQIVRLLFLPPLGKFERKSRTEAGVRLRSCPRGAWTRCRTRAEAPATHRLAKTDEVKQARPDQFAGIVLGLW
ncbi:hypothetical protein L1887_58908 [Cichorium endivia]|nr:hypothetical protein L1887_58908 [Cichorium endivia]